MQILSAPHTGGLVISGGQETVTVGGYKYIVFTSSGTLTVAGAGPVEVCSVGGGGGGGNGDAASSGGGGAGELDIWTSCALTTNVTVTIGAGSLGATTDNTNASNGGTTTFGSFTSSLGGGGGGFNQGGTGGSGGGVGYASVSSFGGASGSNTNVGGAGYFSVPAFGSGGGGGATAAGATSTTGFVGGYGGQGYTLTTIDANLTAGNFPTTLIGMTVICSGGGGSSVNVTPGTTTAGLGGTGAGNGAFGTDGGAGTLATAATSYGSGGGAGGYGLFTPNCSDGANAKDGVVIIRQAV